MMAPSEGLPNVTDYLHVEGVPSEPSKMSASADGWLSCWQDYDWSQCDSS